MQSLSLSLILISIHPRNLTVHYSYYFLAVVLLSSSAPSYLSSLFWASLSRSSTLQIVSSVHHLTSSAIPHIFNIIERHQKKSSSSSGIKQTGTLAEQHPLCLLNCVGLCCADKQVPIGLIYTLIHDVRLSCCVEWETRISDNRLHTTSTFDPAFRETRIQRERNKRGEWFPTIFRLSFYGPERVNRTNPNSGILDFGGSIDDAESYDASSLTRAWYS